MERFRFGEQEGPNGKKYTRNGWLAVWGGEGLALDTGRCSLEVAGPEGGTRAVVVMDKATAGKLGAALLKWAGADLLGALQTLLKVKEYSGMFTAGAHKEAEDKAWKAIAAATGGAPHGAKYCDDCAQENNWPRLPHRVYGICPVCQEGERFCNENL
jgi:hypothetical protein